MKPTLERSKNFGTQRIYRFENGYGASVVQGPYTYGGEDGKWELAVLRLTGKGDTDYTLAYDTPITHDVLGWLDWPEVESTLEAIRALGPKVGQSE